MRVTKAAIVPTSPRFDTTPGYATASHVDTEPKGITTLVELLAGRTAVALTGAGCSTESGIPDYRGPETIKKPRNPIRGPAFVKDEALRRRYWARALVGWERFSRAAPNPAHLALAQLEGAGLLRGIVTQNVDRLHHAAGSRRVVELHGALAEVRCLDCGVLEDRDSVQARLHAANPDALSGGVAIAPDGDADLPEQALERFRVVPCLHCGGVMKPNVVFFGDNVPRPTVDAAFSLVDEADVLLVLGTSLQVFSGYRFVLHAAKKGTPMAFVNLGDARGQEHATVRVEARVGRVLPLVASALLETTGAA